MKMVNEPVAERGGTVLHKAAGQAVDIDDIVELA